MLDSLKVTKKIYDGQVQPDRDLELGGIDAPLIRPSPTTTPALIPSRSLGEPSGEGSYAIAFRKDQEPLARKFDAAICGWLKRASSSESTKSGASSTPIRSGWPVLSPAPRPLPPRRTAKIRVMSRASRTGTGRFSILIFRCSCNPRP